MTNSGQDPLHTHPQEINNGSHTPEEQYFWESDLVKKEPSKNPSLSSELQYSQHWSHTDTPHPNSDRRPSAREHHGPHRTTYGKQQNAMRQ